METFEKENPERQRNLCVFLRRREEERVSWGVCLDRGNVDATSVNWGHSITCSLRLLTFLGLWFSFLKIGNCLSNEDIQSASEKRSWNFSFSFVTCFLGRSLVEKVQVVFHLWWCPECHGTILECRVFLSPVWLISSLNCFLKENTE